MFAAYLTITLLAAVASGSAAVADFAGVEFVKNQADQLRVPRSWMLPLGTLLAAGSLGLLAGVWVPVLGVLAASGLVSGNGRSNDHFRSRDPPSSPVHPMDTSNRLFDSTPPVSFATRSKGLWRKEKGCPSNSSA